MNLCPTFTSIVERSFGMVRLCIPDYLSQAVFCKGKAGTVLVESRKRILCFLEFIECVAGKSFKVSILAYVIWRVLHIHQRLTQVLHFSQPIVGWLDNLKELFVQRCYFQKKLRHQFPMNFWNTHMHLNSPIIGSDYCECSTAGFSLYFYFDLCFIIFKFMNFRENSSEVLDTPKVEFALTSKQVHEGAQLPLISVPTPEKLNCLFTDKDHYSD